MPTFGLWKFLGFDGQSGGVSSFTGDDGSVTARGGEGGQVGTGNRSNSDRLTVSALLLANYIEFREIFGYVSGTGFQLYNVLNLGDNLKFTGMVTVECGSAPSGEYSLTIEALNPENLPASSITPVFEITQPGDMLRICFSFSVSVVVNTFGMWTIVARHGNRDMARLPIVVRQGVPGV